MVQQLLNLPVFSPAAPPTAPLATNPNLAPWSYQYFTIPRYGRNARLRSLVNLVIVGGVTDPAHTGDREEAAECEKMHRLIKDYGLRVRGGSGFEFHRWYVNEGRKWGLKAGK
jgi:hypothetical protein